MVRFDISEVKKKCLTFLSMKHFMFLNGFHSATVVLFVIVKTAYRNLKFNNIHISKNATK